MTRTTSSRSESIAVLTVSTMDAQYQTKRPPVLRVIMSRSDGLSASCPLDPRKRTSVRALAEDASARAVFADPDLPAGDLAVQRLPVRSCAKALCRPANRRWPGGLADLAQDGFAFSCTDTGRSPVKSGPQGYRAAKDTPIPAAIGFRNPAMLSIDASLYLNVAFLPSCHRPRSGDPTRAEQ